jgi:hypothetical protein
MHGLTEKIKNTIPIQNCELSRLDLAIKEWMEERLGWLESGATSLKRIREAFRGEKKIIKNAVYCKVCKTEIESRHRNDYVTCSCGGVSVDGGKDYLKRSFKSENHYEDRSIVS